MDPGSTKPPLALRKCSRVLCHRRASADCFGANPVASALGDLTRRDSGEAVRTYHGGRTLALKTGTFYLAGNRNFLFGSDTRRWRGWTTCSRGKTRLALTPTHLAILLRGLILNRGAHSI